MSSKNLNFLTFCWFISTLICVILEGTYFGATEQGIINNMSLLSTFTVGSFTVPVFNINFFTGLWKMLTWDYSFYTGGYQIVRYFWMCVLSPGAVWGIATAFIWLWSAVISLLRIA